MAHVEGSELESGEQLTGDSGIDATGRRSTVAEWLERWGRGPTWRRRWTTPVSSITAATSDPTDHSAPPMFGPFLQDYQFITCSTLPGDNGTWSVTIAAGTRDAPCGACWTRRSGGSVVKLLPLAAHWLDAEPLDEP